MDDGEKKRGVAPVRSGAATDGQSSAAQAGRTEGRHRLLRVLERVRGKGIVRPTPVLAHGHKAGVTQGLEVEGEQGLGAVECGLEIADALLPAPEQVEDAEAADVGKRVKERGVALEAVSGGGKAHAPIYQEILMNASPTPPRTHHPTAQRGERRLFQRRASPTAATAASEGSRTPLVQTGS